jgi:hypothetical protein
MAKKASKNPKGRGNLIYSKLMIDLTPQELEICIYLKEQGFFEMRGGNMIISISPDGAQIKVKQETFGTRIFRRVDKTP